MWEAVRPRGQIVDSSNIVWYPHCIPRDAFLVLLIMRKKLKTQDTLRQWDVGTASNLNMFLCPFCKLIPDTHDHIFFECSFPAQVWSMVCNLAATDSIGPIWEDIILWMKPLASKRTAVSIIARLVVAATAYYIWQERNLRLFKNRFRSSVQVKDIIVYNVRLKLLTLRFKKKQNVAKVLEPWKIKVMCYASEDNAT